ncbi:MAG TPA: primosomal protein N' [Tepidisphaeraceae bacterium]|jgi:primosomal protein N' (replication factor Y)|nr:primosomal protein N' [Tepidisphaeraceae bacterium]
MINSTLFPDVQLPAPERPRGPFAAVAIERSLDKILDYQVPHGLINSLRVGQRVRVPLGRNNKPEHGYIIAIGSTTDYPKIKPILAIDDQRILIPPKMMELACWMARYYCTPLGSVIDSIIPSAVKKKIGLGWTHHVRLAKSPEEIQAILEKTRAPKRRAILARLLQIKPGESAELLRIASEAGARAATVRKLVKLGLISITAEPDFNLPPAYYPKCGPEEPPPKLNEDQVDVLNELSPRIAAGEFSVNLLHGVTGSGKTEIYLRCIKQAVEMGRRAIVLVPEIALTPQTVQRFTARFDRVAILHSGLPASARHRFWRQIAEGQADVVVGARSAVFAPMPNLGIIVVDEEHEGSYKQDIAPRYHARDVAIKRGQLESVPVLLGSATPSLESWWRIANKGLGFRVGGSGNASVPEPRTLNPEPSIYHLLSLPNRVRNLAMPHIELLDMKQEIFVNRRKGVHLISRRLEHMLRVTFDAGQQAILLLNRRGYSNFVYCPSCTHLVQCRFCDATLTYHRSATAKAKGGSFDEGLHTGQLHCHYCLAVNPLPPACPDCGKKLSLFGLGTQRVEEELARKFPNVHYARVDSDTMRNAGDYEKILSRFASGEIQVMLGTQMIAKGLDYPNVTLVGVISGDTALALPDFRAAERTFQLITQVAGRAGRGDKPGRVILQTFIPDDPTIAAALRQDFVGFASAELKSRQEVGLPPITRMVRIILRDEDLAKLHEKSEKVAAAFAAQIQAEKSNVKLKGPMPCAINRIAGYHRVQILLFAPTAPPLQRLLAAVRAQKGILSSDRIAVDVDPVSLL